MPTVYHIAASDSASESLEVHLLPHTELTAQERADLNGLKFSEWVDEPMEERANMLRAEKCPLVALVYARQHLVAACSLRIDKLATPFSNQKLPVVFTEYHQDGAPRHLKGLPDPFEALVQCALRESIGPSWNLHSTVHMAVSMHPARIEKYHRQGNTIFPVPAAPRNNREAAAFAQEYCLYTLGADFSFPQNFIVEVPGPIRDITPDWAQRFSEHSDRAEEILTQFGVIRFQGDRVLLHPRRILLCAHYTPIRQLALRMNRF